MANLLEIVGNFSDFHPWLIYLFILFGSFIQGEMTVLLSVYLVINRQLPFTGFLTAILFGALMKDLTVYYLARKLKNTKLGLKIHQRLNYEPIEFYLKSSPFSLLTFTRFVFAAGVPVMFLAGWTNLRFKTFIKALGFSFIIWLTTFTTLSYVIMSQVSYYKTSIIFRNFEITLLIIFVIVILSKRKLAKLFRTYIKIPRSVSGD